jgi:hypothetical protein
MQFQGINKLCNYFVHSGILPAINPQKKAQTQLVVCLLVLVKRM